MKANAIITILVVALTMPAYAASLRSAANVTDAMRVCATDDNCMLVDKDCGDCCDLDAVAKTRYILFEMQKRSQCGKPKIACDCVPDETKKPVCVEKRCVLK